MRTPLSCSWNQNQRLTHSRSSCSMRELLTRNLNSGRAREKLRNFTMLTMDSRSSSMADGDPMILLIGLFKMLMMEYLTQSRKRSATSAVNILPMTQAGFSPRLDNLRLLQPIGPLDHTMNHVKRAPPAPPVPQNPDIS